MYRHNTQKEFLELFLTLTIHNVRLRKIFFSGCCWNNTSFSLDNTWHRPPVLIPNSKMDFVYTSTFPCSSNDLGGQSPSDVREPIVSSQIFLLPVVSPCMGSCYYPVRPVALSASPFWVVQIFRFSTYLLTVLRGRPETYWWWWKVLNDGRPWAAERLSASGATAWTGLQAGPGSHRWLLGRASASEAASGRRAAAPKGQPWPKGPPSVAARTPPAWAEAFTRLPTGGTASRPLRPSGTESGPGQKKHGAAGVGSGVGRRSTPEPRLRYPFPPPAR